MYSPRFAPPPLSGVPIDPSSTTFDGKISASQPICPPSRPNNRNAEPHKYGDHPKDGLLVDAQSKALLLRKGNMDWAYDDSLIALRYFAAIYVGSKERDSGHVPECTHFLETAHLAVNLGGYLGIPSDVIAFAAYAHDLVEDFAKDHPEVTPSFIVGSCWKGDPFYRDYLIEIIGLLTDNPNLHGRARLQEQGAIANAEETGAVALIRFCDKYSSLLRDDDAMLGGQEPRKGVDHFRVSRKMRQDLVHQLYIKDSLIRMYDRLVKKTDQTLQDKFGPMSQRPSGPPHRVNRPLYTGKSCLIRHQVIPSTRNRPHILPGFLKRLLSPLAP